MEFKQLLPAQRDAAAFDGLACAQGDDAPLGMTHLNTQRSDFLTVYLSGNADGDGWTEDLSGHGADREFPFDTELISSLHLVNDLLVDRPPRRNRSRGEQEDKSAPDG